jgi:hypothetical protein
MKKCKCDYIGCENDATISGAVYGHIRDSDDKDNFIHVNACDEHSTRDGFFADK